MIRSARTVSRLSANQPARPPMFCRLRNQIGPRFAAFGAFVTFTIATACALAQSPDRPAAPSAPAAAAPASPAAAPSAGPATAADPQRPASSEPDVAQRLADQEKRNNDLEARLAALEEAAAQTEAQKDDSKIRFYGFGDMGFRKLWLKDDSRFRNIMPDKASFLFGSTNLYLDAQPHPKFRALTEVRFALYPNETVGSDFQPVSTKIYDTTSATGRNSVTWSGIVLERAQIEYKQSDLLRVMAGYFLTPYGIWNVDHGSPTLISSAMPGFFAAEYFPTHLQGIQLLGSGQVADWEIGYRAYLANSRGKFITDDENGKLFGGRLYATAHLGAKTTLTLGASGYRGSHVEKAYQIAITDTFGVASTDKYAYDEWGAAGDVSLDSGPFRLRTEFVFHRIDYRTGQRQPYPMPGTFYPDRSEWDTYVIAAYRLPWLGLEPYVFGDCDRHRTYDNDRGITLSGGLNVYLNPAAKIKLQYLHIMFQGERNGTTRDDFDDLDARFVLAF
jgi:hypothetical protein